MNNEKFNEYRTKYPDWSDEQIWTAISLNMETDNVIEKAGDDIDSNDPDIIKNIIDGARKWLKEVLPNVFAKVATFFDQLINTIGVWISKGLSYIVDAITCLLGKD